MIRIYLRYVIVIQILVIILKLYEVIKCSWWWVFAPVWINLILIVILFLISILLINRGEK